MTSYTLHRFSICWSTTNLCGNAQDTNQIVVIITYNLTYNLPFSLFTFRFFFSLQRNNYSHLGDPNKFGRVAFKDITPIWNFCDWWKVDGEEKEQVVRDCLTATSVVSLFSWLNGQAHALGLHKPLTINNCFELRFLLLITLFYVGGPLTNIFCASYQAMSE